MRKLLTATTALALVGGAAFAELSMSGDAEFGTDYTSEPDPGMSKHSFVHEVGIDFSGSGTTDGGLSFGGSAGFDTGDTEVNTGTVFISGAFGKLTTGDNDAADLTAGGIADVGLNGIGVDDVVEDLRGTTASQLRYDNSFGQIAIAISAGTTGGAAAVAATAGDYQYMIPASVYTAATLPDDGPETFGGIFRTTLSAGDMPMPILDDNPILNRAAYVTSFGTAIGIAEGQRSLANGLDDGVGYAEGGDVPLQNPNAPAADRVALTGEALANFRKYEAAFDLGTNRVIDAANDVPRGLRTITAATAAVPEVASDNQYAFGMSFNASGVTVGVGYDSEKTVSMGLGFSTGDISSNLLYVKTDDDTTGIGGDVSYTMGASTLTLAYAQSKPDAGETTDAMGINVSHDLGGGASMVAGFGDVDDVSKASVGLSFSF